MYRSLIDSFEEYRFFYICKNYNFGFNRYMKHEVRQLKFVANDLDSGNICPACPTRDAKVCFT